MSAETLREAAKVLRRRAKQATDGPWTFKSTETLGDGSVFGDVLSPRGSRVGDSDDEGAAFFITDGVYVATMHPGVGLVLADWLDSVARVDLGRGQRETHTGCDADCDVQRALTVARALLGGES